MAEYIEREAAKLRIFEYGVRHRNNSSISSACESLEMQMNSIPAADVRPVVRGHWTTEHLASTRGGTYPVVRCSVCGASLPFFEGTTYCPNCGARMEES